jgi:hypothetical protein
MHRLCDNWRYSSYRTATIGDECTIELRRLPNRIGQKTSRHPISCMLGNLRLLVCTKWDE